MFRLITGLVVFGCLLTMGAVAAQDGGGEFEDLSRQAEAQLDLNPAEAAGLYRKALALRPDWAEGWLYMGACLFRTGHYAQARDAFRKGVPLQPGKGTPVAFLGMTEYELGDYKAAIADIVRGESLGLADKPGFVAAVRYRAALIGLRFSDFALALDQIRPLAKAGDNSPGVIEVLGLSALCMNVLPANLPAAKRPEVELAGRAAWAFVADRPDEADPLFKELEASFPNERGIHYMCGVYRLKSDPAAAEAEFHQEVQVAPGNILAHVQLALLLMKRGDDDGAVKAASEAVRLGPADALSQATLGRALMDTGKMTEAIAALQKAEKLAPQAPRTHFYLSQAYWKTGKTDLARKEKAEWDRLHALAEPADITKP
ncbi:MAG: tetratricopeptide repeat protein [Bryobacteraceae bacterium]|jgi:tetratricopeptide (TPR) repeat protein